MKKALVISTLALAGSYASAACSIFPAPVSEDPECMMEYWEGEASNFNIGDQLAGAGVEIRNCQPKKMGVTPPVPYSTAQTQMPTTQYSFKPAPFQERSSIYHWQKTGSLLMLVESKGTYTRNRTVVANGYATAGGNIRPRLLQYTGERYVEITDIEAGLDHDGMLHRAFTSQAVVSDVDGVLFHRGLNGIAVLRRSANDATKWPLEQVIPVNPTTYALAYDEAIDTLFVADYEGAGYKGVIRAWKNVAGSWSVVSSVTNPLEATAANNETGFGIALAAKNGTLVVAAPSYVQNNAPDQWLGATLVYEYSSGGAISSAPVFMDTVHDGKQLDTSILGQAAAQPGWSGVGIMDNGDIVVGGGYAVAIYTPNGAALSDQTAVQVLAWGVDRNTSIPLRTDGDSIYRTTMSHARATEDGSPNYTYARIARGADGFYRLHDRLASTVSSDSRWSTPIPLHGGELLLSSVLRGAAIMNAGEPTVERHDIEARAYHNSLFDFDSESIPGCEHKELPDALAAASFQASKDGICSDIAPSLDPDCLAIAIQSGAAWAHDEAIRNTMLVTSGLDADGDFFPDDFDNCPYDANSDQSNIDGDAEGDACDGDIDGDGEPNESDDTPSGEDVAEHERLLDNALAQAQPHLDGADQDGDGDFDRNDLDVLLGLEFDSYRPMFGDGSSSAPRDQMLYLAGNRLINILNRISEGDAPGAIVEGAQTYLEVMASAFGTSGGRNELLRAPAETVIDALN